MSIVDLLQIDNTILAVSDAGQAILWDLSEIQKINGAYFFKDNVSLLASKGSLKIDADSLRGIRMHKRNIVMFNQETIYIAAYEQIVQCIKQERVKNITIINTGTFLQKKETINCLDVAADDLDCLLIGTSKGKVYLYDYKNNLVINHHCFSKESQEGSTQVTNFATTAKQVCEINCLAFYAERSHLLVGLSNGKVYSLRVEDLQRVFELTENSKQSFQPVQKIVFSKDNEKLYCLHQTYITEWSIKLASCLSYIDYSHPNDLLALPNRIIIIGNHSKLVWFDSSLKETKLSMRSARVIRELKGNCIIIGGSDGVMDVLVDGMRLMTLFTR